jgi:hypothetical protein
MKVRVECVRILTEIPQGGSYSSFDNTTLPSSYILNIYCAFVVGSSFVAAVKSIGGLDFVSRLTNSVHPHLQKLYVPATEEEGMEWVGWQRPGQTNQSQIPIGFGEVNLFPLCRACIRIGRYMVLRPSSTVQDVFHPLSQAELAQEETRLEGLVRPLGKELAKLTRAFVHSKVHLPHARAEILKALLWIMPDNRSSTAPLLILFPHCLPTVL